MILEGVLIGAMSGAILSEVKTYIDNKNKKTLQEKELRIIALKNKWRKILDECNVPGIKNKSGKTFELINVKETKYGYVCETKLPLGVDLDSLRKAIPTLESNFDSTISITKDKYINNIRIEIITTKPEYPFRTFKTEEDQVFLAYLPNGEPYFVDLNYDPHIVWTGKTRSGKSTAMYVSLVNHLVNCKNIELYIAQVVNGETAIFKDCKQVKMVSTNYDETEVILNKLNSIADNRGKIISTSGSMNIGDYNKKHKNNQLKRLILVMEEFSFFVINPGESDELKKQKQRCEEIFLRIAKAGAYCGIHLFGVVQRMTHNSINPTIRGQVSVFTLKQKDDNDSKYAINTPDAANLDWREAIFSGGGDYKFLIAPTVDKHYQDLKQVLPELKISLMNAPNKEKAMEEVELDLYEQTQILKERAKKEYMHVNENVNNDYKQATGSVAGGLFGKYDKEILRFVEKYKVITISQCEKMFYNNYEQSRSRLSALKAKGVLDSYKDEKTARLVYFTKDKVSSHDLLVRDFYAELVSIGAEIIEFKTFPQYLNDLIRPDAYIHYKYEGKEYHTMLEVDYKHPTEKDKYVLYDKLVSEVPFKFNVVIMIEGDKSPKVKVKKCQIRKINFNLGNLKELLFE